MIIDLIGSIHLFTECFIYSTDIDFYIGQPNHLHHRACRETRAEFGVWFLLSTLIPTTANFVIRMVYSLIRYRTIYLIHLIGNPTDWRVRNG